MPDTVCLKYEKRPSAIIALAKAFWGISWKYDAKSDPTPIHAIWRNVRIPADHLTQFNEICGIETSGRITMAYPLTLVFPLVIRVLGHCRAPLTIFRSLNTKTRITQHREISADDVMNVSCGMAERRIVEKGLEVDLASFIERQGETVWECTQTFFYRGRYGEAGPAHEPKDMKAIANAPLVGEWLLAEGLGFRFAKISGDSNGIHYSARYAKMFGFERDFAQPLLVLPKALECIPEKSKGNRLDVDFKGPLYYNRRVQVRGMAEADGFRFDIYSGNNPRPCICGLMVENNKS